MADLVRDFGAASGADCTAAFVAARAWSLTHPGESLVIRPGVYRLTSLITWSAPIAIAGWGGGFGAYDTRVELTGAGGWRFDTAAGGSSIQGVSVGGWSSRISGAAIEARCPITIFRCSVMTSSVGIRLEGTVGLGNVNLARLIYVTASDCGIGFDVAGNDANSWSILQSQAISCDTGYRTRSTLGSPSIIQSFAECATGRGWDIQSGGASTKLIACYDESLQAPIIDAPAQMIAFDPYVPHVSSGAGVDPATSIGSIKTPSYVRSVHGYGTDPRVWTTLGDPQAQGSVGADFYIDGDGVGAGPHRMQIRVPYIGATHAPYWEVYVPAVSAMRVLRTDGAHTRGTVQIPRLLVGGNPATSTGFGIGATDVAAKLAELEARIAALEVP